MLTLENVLDLLKEIEKNPRYFPFLTLRNKRELVVDPQGFPHPLSEYGEILDATRQQLAILNRVNHTPSTPLPNFDDLLEKVSEFSKILSDENRLQAPLLQFWPFTQSAKYQLYHNLVTVRRNLKYHILPVLYADLIQKKLEASKALLDTIDQRIKDADPINVVVTSNLSNDISVINTTDLRSELHSLKKRFKKLPSPPFKKHDNSFLSFNWLPWRHKTKDVSNLAQININSQLSNLLIRLQELDIYTIQKGEEKEEREKFEIISKKLQELLIKIIQGEKNLTSPLEEPLRFIFSTQPIHCSDTVRKEKQAIAKEQIRILLTLYKGEIKSFDLKESYYKALTMCLNVIKEERSTGFYNEIEAELISVRSHDEALMAQSAKNLLSEINANQTRLKAALTSHEEVINDPYRSMAASQSIRRTLGVGIQLELHLKNILEKIPSIWNLPLKEIASQAEVANVNNKVKTIVQELYDLYHKNYFYLTTPQTLALKNFILNDKIIEILGLSKEEIETLNLNLEFLLKLKDFKEKLKEISIKKYKIHKHQKISDELTGLLDQLPTRIESIVSSHNSVLTEMLGNIAKQALDDYSAHAESLFQTIEKGHTHSPAFALDGYELLLYAINRHAEHPNSSQFPGILSERPPFSSISTALRMPARLQYTHVMAERPNEVKKNIDAVVKSAETGQKIEIKNISKAIVSNLNIVLSHQQPFYETHQKQMYEIISDFLKNFSIHYSNLDNYREVLKQILSVLKLHTYHLPEEFGFLATAIQDALCKQNNLNENWKMIDKITHYVKRIINSQTKKGTSRLTGESPINIDLSQVKGPLDFYIQQGTLHDKSTLKLHLNSTLGDLPRHRKTMLEKVGVLNALEQEISRLRQWSKITFFPPAPPLPGGKEYATVMDSVINTNKQLLEAVNGLSQISPLSKVQTTEDVHLFVNQAHLTPYQAMSVHSAISLQIITLLAAIDVFMKYIETVITLPPQSGTQAVLYLQQILTTLVNEHNLSCIILKSLSTPSVLPPSLSVTPIHAIS